MTEKQTAATVKESLTTGDRERFENWASDDGEYPKAIECVGNCYRLAQTHAYWMAWHKCSTESPAIAVIDSQAAEIERLRGALKKISRIKDQLYGGEWDEIEKARKIAKKALSGEKQ